MTAAEEITTPNWRCLRCDVWNAPRDDRCMVCETDRTAATDASVLVPLPRGARTSGTGRPGPTPNPPRGRGPSATPPGWPGAPPAPRPGAPGPRHPSAAHPVGAYTPHSTGMPTYPPVPPGPTGEVFFPPVAPVPPPMAPPWAPGGPYRGLPPARGPAVPPPAHDRPGWRPTDLTVARVVGLGCGGLLLLYFLLAGCAALVSSLA